MWRWTVTSELGRVQGVSETPERAAAWVQMFMLRSPSPCEAVISGPGAQCTELVSLNGVIQEVTSS